MLGIEGEEGEEGEIGYALEEVEGLGAPAGTGSGKGHCGTSGCGVRGCVVATCTVADGSNKEQIFRVVSNRAAESIQTEQPSQFSRTIRCSSSVGILAVDNEYHAFNIVSSVARVWAGAKGTS